MTTGAHYLLMSDFNTFQQDVGEWSQENFGDQPAHYPLLGVDEEGGELADNLVISSTPNEAEKDAIGDVLVYTADFCARRNLDLQCAFNNSQDYTPRHANFFQEWTAAKGELSRSILKNLQGIDHSDKYNNGERVGKRAEQQALTRIICALEDFATKRGYTLEDCIQIAWHDEVKDREWDSTLDSGCGRK